MTCDVVPHGGITNDSLCTVTYDAENRTVQVNAVGSSALVATYSYESANRRIKKTVGTTTTCYIFSHERSPGERRVSARSHARFKFAFAP